MSTPNANAWELAGFPGRLDVAAYLTADQLAAQYRVLVDVLLDAQETSEAADLHRWLRRKIDEDAVSTSAAAFAPAIIAERLDDTISAIGQRDLGQAAQSWAQAGTCTTSATATSELPENGKGPAPSKQMDQELGRGWPWAMLCRRSCLTSVPSSHAPEGLGG
ncbi:MAG TPA: hypothetical protein VMU95_19020 [Trebonia sp.]|nr:hypothetical protein [Trebonia sp.]